MEWFGTKEEVRKLSPELCISVSYCEVGDVYTIRLSFKGTNWLTHTGKYPSMDIAKQAANVVVAIHLQKVKDSIDKLYELAGDNLSCVLEMILQLKKSIDTYKPENSHSGAPENDIDKQDSENN